MSQRPDPAFIALRAAVLGIDDLSRQELRAWIIDAVSFRGQVNADVVLPAARGAAVIAAAALALSDEARVAFRRWISKWTDYSGRIITPAEALRRRNELLAWKAEHQKQSR
jgi:hypothetical protein